MKYRINGPLEDNEAVSINKISKDNEEEVKKVYRIKKNGYFRNIIEEKNTIYEVDYECVNRHVRNNKIWLY